MLRCCCALSDVSIEQQKNACITHMLVTYENICIITVCQSYSWRMWCAGQPASHQGPGLQLARKLPAVCCCMQQDLYQAHRWVEKDFGRWGEGRGGGGRRERKNCAVWLTGGWRKIGLEGGGGGMRKGRRERMRKKEESREKKTEGEREWGEWGRGRRERMWKKEESTVKNRGRERERDQTLASRELPTVCRCL